ncbi:MAG: ribosome recycling factor [Patescibacteria group bacterium]
MNIDSYRNDFEKIIEHLKGELGALRTSRATPALVEHISVEAYGTHQPLKTLASMSVPDPRTLIVEPWDKSIIKEMEKAVAAAGTGLNPVNDGNVLRIVLPSLNEESRKQLVKLLSSKVEEARVAVRGVREKVRTVIQVAEKAKEMNEDERYRLQEKLDSVVGEYNERIKKLGEDKEREIMTV